MVPRVIVELALRCASGLDTGRTHAPGHRRISRRLLLRVTAHPPRAPRAKTLTGRGPPDPIPLDPPPQRETGDAEGMTAPALTAAGRWRQGRLW